MSSWAEDAVERDAWCERAQRMIGLRVQAVRYYDIDYRREDRAPGLVGPRSIDAAAEWAEPTFQFPGGHTIDYGLELEGDDGSIWSLTWDPPGDTEGLLLDHVPLVGNALHEHAAVAIWDVSNRTPWRDLLGKPISQVDVDYEPWDESGAWWCRRLVLYFPDMAVELLEAEGNPDGAVTPSADNIVVRFPSNGVRS